MKKKENMMMKKRKMKCNQDNLKLTHSKRLNKSKENDINLYDYLNLKNILS